MLFAVFPVVCRSYWSQCGPPAVTVSARTLVSCSEVRSKFSSSLEPRAPVCILFWCILLGLRSIYLHFVLGVCILGLGHFIIVFDFSA